MAKQIAVDWLTASQEGDVCPVCIDNYDNPVFLQCKHNFCIECVRLIMKSNDGKHTVTCPLCESITDVKEGNLETLPVNMELQNISEMRRNSRSNTQINEIELTQRLEKLQHASRTVIPRTFKLLQEYEASIGKDGKTLIPDIHTGYINYGIDDANSENKEDFILWTGMVIGPQDSPIGQNIYYLEITIPDEYPMSPPIITIVDPPIKMKCVNDSGNVDVSNIEIVDITNLDGEGMVDEGSGELYVWSPDHNIADVLVALRNNMHLRSVCTNSSADYGEGEAEGEGEGEGEGENQGLFD